MNKHRYGNIFPLIQSALDREIQGLSFDVWYAVEIKWVKGCKLEFLLVEYNIHVFYIGEGMVWNSEVFDESACLTKLRLQKEC